MMSTMKMSFLCSVLLLILQPAQAEIYKWVDEHGTTHYGEKPPSKGKAKQIQLRNQPLSDTTATPDSAADKTKATETESRLEKQQKLIRALSEDRQQKKEQKERAERMEKQRIRNCAVSKDNLRRYENSSAVYKVDDKGNRVILPNASRDQSISRARAEVQKWCGK